jgi:hypothetical protein
VVVDENNSYVVNAFRLPMFAMIIMVQEVTGTCNGVLPMSVLHSNRNMSRLIYDIIIIFFGKINQFFNISDSIKNKNKKLIVKKNIIILICVCVFIFSVTCVCVYVYLILINF